MNRFGICALAALGIVVASSANAAAIRNNAGFNGNTLAPNDDGSTGFVSFGFANSINFFGVSYTGGWVNNNGNMTFDAPLATFTPFNILTTGRPMLAPFFADVDTRNAGDPVRYGTSTVNGRDAFGVNWINVDFFSSSVTHTERNSFQLVIIDRSDRGAGDFDFEFNYDCIEWEAGQASGGNANGDWVGPGGGPARAGWSNGILDAFEIAGSGVDNAFLSATGNCADGFLVANSLGSNVDGRWTWSVVNGQVMPPIIPLPTAGVMGLAGLLALGARRRRAL